jgi:hypothetical protein
VPDIAPFYPRQLDGILAGIKGAWDYETLLQRAYPRFAGETEALAVAFPQSIVHGLLILMVVALNAVYLGTRRRSGGTR